MSKEDIIMKKLLKKLKSGVAFSLCLSLLMAGAALLGNANVAKAAEPIKMQTVYTDGTTAVLKVKVDASLYPIYDTILEIKVNGTVMNTFTVPAGTTTSPYYFDAQNYATITYDGGEGVYEVTFYIQRSSIPYSGRAFFLLSNGSSSNNGGSGYYIFE